MQLTGTRKTLQRRIDALRRASHRSRGCAEERVREALSDPYRWASEYTQTYNEHWVEEGRPSAYEPFPRHLLYLQPLFEGFELERILWIVKITGYDDLLGLSGVLDLEGDDDATLRIGGADAERMPAHRYGIATSVGNVQKRLVGSRSTCPVIF